MTVTVLLFASYAEVFGASSIALELPAEATVGELVAMLRARAGGDRLPPAPAVALNQRYARFADRVGAGDEVAVIPPVAGG